MDLLKKCLSEWDIDIDDKKLELFDRYYELLISWNEKFNLTTITEKEDVIIRHFVDSISLMKFTDISGKKLLDVGTGAGFPGIPLKIMAEDCSITLIDSLNKRVRFLDEVISSLEFKGINAVHSRAEDLAKDKEYRETFDIVTSRAVANLSTLSEYCLPFVNIGGLFISYKSINIDDEYVSAEGAVSSLGGRCENIEKFNLPLSDTERSLVFIIKSEHTSERFPRKAGMPLKKPLS